MKIAHSFFTVCVKTVSRYHFNLAYVILQMAVKEFFETHIIDVFKDCIDVILLKKRETRNTVIHGRGLAQNCICYFLRDLESKLWSLILLKTWNVRNLITLLLRQFLTIFSQPDWFLDVLKIRTDARQWEVTWEFSKRNKQWLGVFIAVFEHSRNVSST